MDTVVDGDFTNLPALIELVERAAYELRSALPLPSWRTSQPYALKSLPRPIHRVKQALNKVDLTIQACTEKGFNAEVVLGLRLGFGPVGRCAQNIRALDDAVQLFRLRFPLSGPPSQDVRLAMDAVENSIRQLLLDLDEIIQHLQTRLGSGLPIGAASNDALQPFFKAESIVSGALLKPSRGKVNDTPAQVYPEVPAEAIPAQVYPEVPAEAMRRMKTTVTPVYPQTPRKKSWESNTTGSRKYPEIAGDEVQKVDSNQLKTSRSKPVRRKVNATPAQVYPEVPAETMRRMRRMKTTVTPVHPQTPREKSWESNTTGSRKSLEIAGDEVQKVDSNQLKTSRQRHIKTIWKPSNSQDAKPQDHQRMCLQGTRSSLLIKIEDWINAAMVPEIFWLHGMVGTGKTAISHTVAKTCIQQTRLSARFSFLEYVEYHHWRPLFVSLATQLSEQIPGLQEHVAEALAGPSSFNLTRPSDQITAILLEPLILMATSYDFTASTMVLILDALECCAPNCNIGELLDLLCSIGSRLGVRLRIFVTSRPELSVGKGFRSLDSQTYLKLALEDAGAGTVDQDLRLYFEHHLRSLLDTLSVEARESYIAALIRCSAPLFLVADSMVSYILDRETGHLDALDLITESQHPLLPYFRPTYKPILAEALAATKTMYCSDMEAMHEFHHMLGSLILLVEPLSAKQLGNILGLEPEQILRMLYNLQFVIVSPRSEDVPIERPHSSFVEYITSDIDADLGPNMGYRHYVLAHQCLKRLGQQHLLKSVLITFSSTNSSQQRPYNEFSGQVVAPDVAYACSHWPYHVIQSRYLFLGEDITGFLRAHLIRWLKILSKLGSLSKICNDLIQMSNLVTAEQVLTSDQVLLKNTTTLIGAYQYILKSKPSLGSTEALRVAIQQVDDGQDFWRELTEELELDDLDISLDRAMDDESRTQSQELSGQQWSLESKLEERADQFVNTTVRDMDPGEGGDLHRASKHSTRFTNLPEPLRQTGPNKAPTGALHDGPAFNDTVLYLPSSKEILTIAKTALLDPSFSEPHFFDRCSYLVGQLIRELTAEARSQFGLGQLVVLETQEDFDELANDILSALTISAGQVHSSTEHHEDPSSQLRRRFIPSSVSRNSSEGTLIKVLPFDMTSDDLKEFHKPSKDDNTSLVQPYRNSASLRNAEGNELDPNRHHQQTALEILQDTRAYLKFKTGLLDYAHIPHRDRLRNALGADVYSESGEKLNEMGREAVTHELSWVPMECFNCLQSEDLSLPDSMKGFVEDVMGETWDWWPLSPRRRALCPGYHRWKWQAPCGDSRFIDIPEASSQKMREAIESTPHIVNSCEVTSKATEKVAAAATSSSTQGRNYSQQPSSTAGGSSTQPNASGGSQRAGHQPSAVQKYSGSTQQATSSRPSYLTGGLPLPSEIRHVYFCVKASSEYYLSTLNCDALKKDVDFFHELKEKYLKVRGPIRNLLSMWRYDHCQFVRFRKYGVNLYEPTRIDFPLDTDTLYDFTPRPMHSRPPDGPISEGEFRDHFYKSCHPCHSWHRHQLQRWLFNQQENSAVQSLPKRIEELELRDGKREEFWGIFAKERRCFAWVLGYAILCNMPGTIFFFLWLFQWKHATDLQDASIPVMLSLSLTIGFVSLLYESRERSF